MSVSPLSNFSLATNASAYSSTFPTPTAPDVLRCSGYYSFEAPIILDKCRIAWDSLPRGPRGYPWYTNPSSSPASESQLRLPIEIDGGQCRIKISASGKYAEEVNFPVYISGNTMRDMVGRIIDDCVEAREGRHQTPWGGVSTKYIGRTLDWLVERGTGFPESLDIPITTTFLTAMVYLDDRLDYYEPGAQSKVLSKVLLDWIDAAAGRLPRESPFWGVLANRYFYIWKAREEQEGGTGSHGQFPNWWDDVQTGPYMKLERANRTNGTGGGVSIARRGARSKI